MKKSDFKLEEFFAALKNGGWSAAWRGFLATLLVALPFLVLLVFALAYALYFVFRGAGGMGSLNPEAFLGSNRELIGAVALWIVSLAAVGIPTIAMSVLVNAGTMGLFKDVADGRAEVSFGGVFSKGKKHFWKFFLFSLLVGAVVAFASFLVVAPMAFAGGEESHRFALAIAQGLLSALATAFVQPLALLSVYPGNGFDVYFGFVRKNAKILLVCVPVFFLLAQLSFAGSLAVSLFFPLYVAVLHKESDSV